MEGLLEFAAAGFAFIAAVFWFCSAYGKLPPMATYWNETPSHDPFYMAVKFSAKMNRWGALFSGLSAFLISMRLFYNWWAFSV
jgi:hypothetical protein